MEGKKQKKYIDNPKENLSTSKKRIFWLITLLLPVLFFLLLESGLRYADYDGNMKLFEDGPSGYEDYLRCNLNVARRYFEIQSGIPTPSQQVFLKVKPQNGYRIFVLGESSAAGFPYGSNVSFPNFLERALSKTFPDKRIEVINVSMAAINSYSLLDFTDEILEQAPDVILIYAGHNEYYGALGISSKQTLGNSRWFIHTYLKLRSVKTVLLLRDFIGWIKAQSNKLFSGSSKINTSSTLMERMVANQTIPYGSRLYEAGKEQFKDNINQIIQKAAAKNVPVILSELVSNIKDQKPFISVKDENNYSADVQYEKGKQLEADSLFIEANKYYKSAKNRDALRFRAPEDFNTILRELAKKYNLALVPTVAYFEKESPRGIIGNNLILEHLHPNRDGYFLIAKAFYETMKDNHFISNVWAPDSIDRERTNGITVLDSVYAALSVQQLKGSWPFKPMGTKNYFMQNFQPKNEVEQAAFQVITDRKFPEDGHKLLGEFYDKRGELLKAYQEYNALVASFPAEYGYYERAALVLMKAKEYRKAEDLLLTSLKYKVNKNAYKWIGHIAMMNNDCSKAISFLQKADMNDNQVIFVLSSACYLDNKVNLGDKYFIQLQNLNPNREQVAYLAKLRTQSLAKLNDLENRDKTKQKIN